MSKQRKHKKKSFIKKKLRRMKANTEAHAINTKEKGVNKK